MLSEQLLAQCEFSYTRASGPGGQHVNKTDSAVQLLHIPTGIRIKMAEHRSQYLNKQAAVIRLQEILLERKQKAQQERIETYRRNKPKRRPPKVKAQILKAKKINAQKKSARKKYSGE